MKQKEKTYYFTFGCGTTNAQRFVKIKGTLSSTRQEMFKHFGDHWAFQYSEKQWNSAINNYGKPISQEVLYGLTEIKIKR